VGGRVRGAAALLLSVVAGLLAALVFAAPASAHNSLSGSSPKDGARLAKAPTTVRLTFLSRLDPRATKITVTGPDGESASGGAATFDGNKATIPFRAGPAGRYTVAYQLPSSDGHPIKGDIQFTLTVAAAPSPSPAAPPSASPGAAVPPNASASPSVTVPPGVAVSIAPVAAERDDESGTPVWPWAVGGAILVAAIAAVVLRRRQS
jgi:copper resistance protein C